MNGIDPAHVEFALTKIEDGFVFERFAQAFIGSYLGHTFVPVGGLKDRAIDGLEHTFHRGGYERDIYQISIEKDVARKLSATIDALKKNNIRFDRLCFVTNQVFPEKDKAIDSFFDKHRKPLQIIDRVWFGLNGNSTPGTVQAFRTFVDSHLHEFNRPGKSYVVSNLLGDPRLYVFLRQQWDEKRKILELDKILADTLILYCLEGTDPDKNILKSAEDIKRDIATLIHFDPKALYNVIDERLRVLSRKPRKINYHALERGYCLPYDTRTEILARNLQDKALHENFLATVETRLRANLGGAQVIVKDCLALIEKTINQVFYMQGLEFADFVLTGGTTTAVEKDLADIISRVVDESSVVLKNRQAVKRELLVTIREIVYTGTKDQKLFLERLSNTYMMLFLLQCDPKVATFFNTMASKLTMYVCTSLIIPALSEYYLEPINRRHWNLLVGAHKAGVKLIINETILNELISHFKKIASLYETDYKELENYFVNGDLQLSVVDEIMLKAYFYARSEDKVKDFSDFLDTFVSPDLTHAREELVEWLKSNFGIEFRSDQHLGIKIDENDKNALMNALLTRKHSTRVADNDARLILAVYALREMRNETGTSGIVGYKTWWLSKDTVTHETVKQVFTDRYQVSCYIRPDFLYNYISLAPTKGDVDNVFLNLFPSLLGVNISSHLPRAIIQKAHALLAEYRQKNPERLPAMVRRLAEKLKADPDSVTRLTVNSFFDTAELSPRAGDKKVAEPMKRIPAKAPSNRTSGR